MCKHACMVCMCYMYIYYQQRLCFAPVCIYICECLSVFFHAMGQGGLSLSLAIDTAAQAQAAHGMMR